MVKDRLIELLEMKARAEELVAQRQCFSLKDLAVNGKDVIAAGVVPGPEVGKVLNELLERVMNGDAANQRQELLKLLDCERSGG